MPDEEREPTVEERQRWTAEARKFEAEADLANATRIKMDGEARTALASADIQIHRGRSYELDRQEAGTLQLVLDNRNRYFDPSYVSGPYYGLLKPMRRIRVYCTWKGVTYYLFITE